MTFLSHLVVDTFTNAGIMWLYPLSIRYFSYEISIHSWTGDVVIWAYRSAASDGTERSARPLSRAE
ncbi:metal-dependent hydrolase [Haladaptatus paucihalophilus]|uniref:metal-dependent hydrolase n=1 Tax=Haladaptatus paucihalophilus TaxID=367189 RepID=UPI0011125659